MKHRLVLTTLLSLLLAGCKEPSEVEVISDLADRTLEISAISLEDTNYVATQFDSTAVLPYEQLRFAGRLTLNKVTQDTGGATHSETFSRVLFENRARPVRFLGRVFGYHGINLGAVLLDGDGMNRVVHRIPVRRPIGDSIVVAGFEYVAGIPSFMPNHRYTWDVTSPDSINPFSLSVTSSDDLTVHSPVGGSTLMRSHDLQLRWTGAGNISIIISGVEPGVRRIRPLLRARPRLNTGSAVLSHKVLALLPSRFHSFVFTFVLANRIESAPIGRFEGRVLVQAASVYNSYIELQ